MGIDIEENLMRWNGVSLYIYIVHTNCVESVTDATRVVQCFVNEGAMVVQSPEEADIILVATCGYMKCQEELSQMTVTEFCKHVEPGQRIIVFGCYQDVLTKANSSNDIVVVKAMTEDAFAECGLPIQLGSVLCPDVKIMKTCLPCEIPRGLLEKVDALERIVGHTVETARLKRGAPWFAADVNNGACFVRVGRGCIGKCNYCAVKAIKMLPVSEQIDHILWAVGDRISAGYQRFVLCADDAGAYGHDLGYEYPKGLIELLFQLCALSPDIELYLNYLEPQALYSPELVSILESNHMIKRVCIPFQSGSSRLVKAMNRNYCPKEIMSKIREIRRNNPGLMISTQLIIGYPGETDEDFDDTLLLVQSKLFDVVVTADFCPMHGTKAAKLPQIGLPVILDRLRRVREEQNAS